LPFISVCFDFVFFVYVFVFLLVGQGDTQYGGGLVEKKEGKLHLMDQSFFRVGGSLLSVIVLFSFLTFSRS